MKLVHEVLEEARKKRAKADKIKVLKDNETWALKDILLGSTDTTIAFNVPAGAPPYTPSPAESAPTNLLNKNKEFRWFVKGGPGDNLKNFEREKRFISRPVIDEAFPGLLQDEG